MQQLLRNMIKIEQKSLTHEELLAHGLIQWNSDLYLIPIELQKRFDPEQNVVCINNSTCKLKEADTDTRDGILAYGFLVKNI